MKESNSSRNIEDVKIHIQLKEQERVLHTKVIEKWKKKIKEQKGNKQAKLIEENALQDKTGKQVGSNFKYFINSQSQIYDVELKKFAGCRPGARVINI